METVLASGLTASLKSLYKLVNWKQGATFEFMDHQYVANARGRFYSLFEPWVYDATISSKDGGLLIGSSRHLMSEAEAIEHAFYDFKNNAVRNKLISREQANQLIINPRGYDFIVFKKKANF